MIGIASMKMHSVLCLKCVIVLALGLLILLLLTLAVTVPMTVLLIVLWTVSFSFFLNGKVVFIMCNPFCLIEKDCIDCDYDCELFDYHSAVLDEMFCDFYDSVI